MKDPASDAKKVPREMPSLTCAEPGAPEAVLLEVTVDVGEDVVVDILSLQLPLVALLERHIFPASITRIHDTVIATSSHFQEVSKGERSS